MHDCFRTPVCFLNCHLPAHMGNLEQWMEDFESILQQQQFEGSMAVGVLDHEWVPGGKKKQIFDAQAYELLKLNYETFGSFKT